MAKLKNEPNNTNSLENKHSNYYFSNRATSFLVFIISALSFSLIYRLGMMLKIFGKVSDLLEQHPQLSTDRLRDLPLNRFSNKASNLKNPLPLQHIVNNDPAIIPRRLSFANGLIELSNLDGSNGVKITGETPDDYSGFSVSSAGDVNDDGVDDVIIGAFFSSSSVSHSGTSYIVYGGAHIGSDGVVALSNLDGSNGVKIIGERNGGWAYSGYSVSAAGDVNGDGVDDVIIGAPNTGTNREGASYIVYGGAHIGSNGVVALSDLNGNNGVKITGTNHAQIGHSVSAAGDVNGDGVDDVIIGAPNLDDSYNGLGNSGASYIVYGDAHIGSNGLLAVSDLNGSNGVKIAGVTNGASSGFSVSFAGDVNGDGVDDVIIGAPSTGTYSEGASYIVYGGAHIGSNGLLAVSDVDGSNGVTIMGGVFGSQTGMSVSAAGDVNGDGVDDVIIGASRLRVNGYLQGASYIVYGGTNIGCDGVLDLRNLNSSTGVRIMGAGHDKIGYSVSAAGDVNGDGVDDVIIGAPYVDDTGKEDSGASYIVYGGADIGSDGVFALSDLNGNNGVKISGETADDFSGCSVSVAGDINEDGYSDVIIGAFKANPNGKQSGISYILYGASIPTAQPSSLPLADPSTIPTGRPSSQPSPRLSSAPTAHPSSISSANPISTSTGTPSSQLSNRPSSESSVKPTAEPSILIDNNSSNRDKLSNGMVILIVTSSGAITILAALLVCCCVKRNSKWFVLPGHGQNQGNNIHSNDQFEEGARRNLLANLIIRSMQTASQDLVRRVHRAISSVPPQFTCPITLEIMQDPVIAEDGNSYERAAIQKWFNNGHRTSPLTNGRLAHINLVPNHALRKMIEDYQVGNRYKHQAKVYQVTPEIQLIEPSAPPLPENKVAHARWKILRHNIIFQQSNQLGRGGFGFVYRGIWKDGIRDKAVAIKELLGNQPSNEAKEELFREAEMMVTLHSPFIVQLYGLCADNHGCLLVMELMDKGSLYDLLHKSDTVVSLALAIQLMRDMIQGLEYLHENNIIHRDLKSLNVLLCKDGGSLKAKLADFGLAKLTHSESGVSTMNRAMSPLWAAPEQFSARPVISKAIDIYAFAVIMRELIAREVPHSQFLRFGPCAQAQIMKKVTEGGRDSIPSDCPQNIANLIGQCWQQRAEDRPKAEAARKAVMRFRA